MDVGCSFDRPHSLKNQFVLLYVSRFYPYKNHELIPKVASYLKKIGEEDLVFLITVDARSGGGKRFMQGIKGMSLDRNVVNIGEMPQDELVKWYRISDCLFYPSLVETFGNALFLEDHSGGDDGPGQRPPSGFIDAAHQARNAGENARLVSKIRHRRAYSAGITAARTGDPAER